MQMRRHNYMKLLLLSWQFWAVLSAFFAALTAIFAKVGIENINSDFATFIRTVVTLLRRNGNRLVRSHRRPGYSLPCRASQRVPHGFAIFVRFNLAMHRKSPRSIS